MKRNGALKVKSNVRTRSRTAGDEQAETSGPASGGVSSAKAFGDKFSETPEKARNKLKSLGIVGPDGKLSKNYS